MRTQVVEIGGRTTTVDVWAAPPDREEAVPIVLLHGLPGWRGNLRAMGDRLARTRAVVAPDLLGFGDSGPLDPPGHAAEEAGMVLDLLDVLGHRRIALFGHDFGGPVALHLARRAPDRVVALGLAATNAFPDTPIPGPLALAKVPWLGEAFFRLAFGRLGVGMLWRFAVADREAFPWTRYRELLGFEQGLATTRRLFLQSLRDLHGLYGPIAASLGDLRVPAVVLWGDRDPFFPVSVGERTAQAIPGARFVLLRGCGHFVPEERPDEAASALLALL
jgi:pimeloyl-ACP methyl ester carboxylesterase